MRRRYSHPVAGAALLLLAAALLLPEPALAQATASSIHGVIRSNSEPVSNATVTAVSTETGFRHTAVSDAQGRYALRGLNPGVFTLTVDAEAFAPRERTVQVLVDQTAQADFNLSPGETFGEEVNVVGSAPDLLLETRSSEISTNITPLQIQTLPQNSRNFLSFAALAPGVRFTENEDEAGKKFRSGGQDARQVNVFVDGLSYKNDLLQGGAFMQDSSRGNPFPQNAVQEFRVLTQNYKAEYEKASAAVITAVTKSGGNDFAGEAFWLYQDKGMVTQDDISKMRGDEKPDYSRDQYGVSFGGPIIQDKLHFFVSYEGNEQDRAVSIFRGPDFANAPADVQSALSRYETGTLTTPLDSDLYFGKLSWQPAVGQNVFASFHRRSEQEIRGFGGQRTLDGAESFEVGTDALVVKHSAVIGNVFNEAAATLQNMEWNPSALASSAPRLNYIGILDTGGKDATQDFQQDKIGLRDDLTYLTDWWRGTHTFKVGASVNWLDYEVTKQQFENGLYEFRSDERWQFPFQARVGFGDPSLKFSNTEVGVYAQDDWDLRDNLTLNLGVRWDYETNMINNDYRTPPELVAAMQEACRTFDQPVGGQNTWCLRDFLDFSRFTTDGNQRDPYYGMIQPRLGFSWDVNRDGRTVVFGGWGRYYDRVILNDIFDEAYRQQFRIYSFCFSADGSPVPNCGVPALQWDPSYLDPDALRQLIANGQSPGPEVFLVDNDLRPPKSDQWTIGVRRQLGRWLASLSYANVRGENGLIYFFADLPPGTDFDNRFGGNVPIPGYGRAFYTSTARKTWYDAVYLSLDRPIGGGRWGANIAYTYSDAEQNGTDNPGEGVAFGAFDYGSPADLYRFPASNNEDHRVVATGIVRLGAGFTASSVITLGSGVPYTIFDDSTAPFTVRWNEGQPKKYDFIIPNAWAYRSVDLRLEWAAPPIHDVQVTLIGEGFNVFNFDNYNAFDNFKPRLPAVNEKFGQGTSEFNTRRLQVGARVSF